jgi:hypothetical protein
MGFDSLLNGEIGYAAAHANETVQPVEKPIT